MSKEHPILFSTDMVKAILTGNKTMTRRVVKTKSPIKSYEGDFDGSMVKPDYIGTHVFDLEEGEFCDFSPYGKAGDILWVREAWAIFSGIEPKVEYVYKADKIFDTPAKEHLSGNSWKPSIHMPKEACRLFLKITDIRVERLQDISEEDAKAEGAQRGILQAGPNTEKGEFHLELNNHGSYKNGFQFIWQSINGEESWNSNSWVWVIQFTQIEKPANWCAPADTKEAGQ